MSGPDSPARTVVFVHGNFVTKHSWERWVRRYEARGLECVTVEYPGRDKSVAELKDDQATPS